MVVIKNNAVLRLVVWSWLLGLLGASALTAQERPNILWLSSEDNGPHLGAYGDPLATTPHLDQLAAEGVRYTRAWSNAPVCAPARTTIISGLYPPSTGSQHMRSKTRLPEGFRFFPQLLRHAGYYATNNAKEDYNLEKPGQVWDESSRDAHWRNRPPGKPFFAVFNVGHTHESQIRKRPHQPVHDPERVVLPGYHPDLPEVRRDWAQYYDKMTEMDQIMGEHLKALEQAGLKDSTIVVYWGDHGIGLPRGKRTALDSGLRVPLIVRIPERFGHLAPEGFAPGKADDRLVGFIDFAPTMLELAGVPVPAHYPGRSFLGEERSEYLIGFRGRMDERIDFVRTIFDGRYVYSRNYMPHRSHGQHVHYLFQTETTQVWRALYDAGGTNEAQSHFFRPEREPVELYDLEADPHELRNLAGSSEHKKVRDRLGQALHAHMKRTRDLGFLPEAELRARARDRTPWELGHDDSAYPLERIAAVAEAATRALGAADASADGSDDVSTFLQWVKDEHAAVRYWAVIGLLRVTAHQDLQAKQDKELQTSMQRALADSSDAVAITAAEYLARYGNPALKRRAIELLLARADVRSNPAEVVWQALNALDLIDSKMLPASQLRRLTKRLEQLRARFRGPRSGRCRMCRGCLRRR